MKNLAKILLLGLAMSTTNASAAYIDGMLLIGGTYQAVNGGTDLATTTSVSITDAVFNFATSDILADIDTGAIGSGSSVSLAAPALPVNGFIVFDGWTLDITSLSVDAKTSNALDLSGTGTLWKTGYDLTPAEWSFSAETASSYSMSITAVPVPAAVWLFGSGLIGLAGIARRKA